MKETRKPVETLDGEKYYEKERPFIAMKRQCAHLWTNFNQFLMDAKICEMTERMGKYLTSNPVLLAACIAAIAAVAVPLLLFILFAVVNVAFAFTSFIIIEVTVLTIGATLLCCMLFCIISTITVMGLCLVLTYYVAYYILSLLKSIKMASI